MRKFLMVTIFLMTNVFAFEATSITDSISEYKISCLRATFEDGYYGVFRKSRPYIEHLGEPSRAQAIQMFRFIRIHNRELLDNLDIFKPHESVGGPFLHRFSRSITCSTALVRYIAILCDIMNRHGSLDAKHVVEIGAGFGGQCYVLSVMFPNARFTLIDIPEALELQKKVLAELGVKNVEFLTPEQAVHGQGLVSDYVISNYAFSECRGDMQKSYIEKIIANSESGYMILNTIGGGFSINTLSKSEIHTSLCSYFTSCRMLPEFVSTHPGNYTLVW